MRFSHKGKLARKPLDLSLYSRLLLIQYKTCLSISTLYGVVLLSQIVHSRLAKMPSVGIGRRVIGEIISTENFTNSHGVNVYSKTSSHFTI